MIQNRQDLEEKIFFEAKNIVDKLAKINSKEELLNNDELLRELNDQISFLKILDQNKNLQIIERSSENANYQISDEVENLNKPFQEEEALEDFSSEEDFVEEEVMFTNEINDIDNFELTENTSNAEGSDVKLDHEIQPEHFQSVETEEEQIEALEIHPSPEQIIPLEEVLPTYEERVAQKEKEFLEMEERRRKIVEFSRQDHSQPVSSEVVEEKQQPQLSIEKKFKLANIKGIKAVKNLFDEDPLEKVEEEEEELDRRDSEMGSILKTNIATDFMEAAKKRPEFRIDFNDKIAFTKLLFKGDEAELRKTVDQLNSYENAADAKQYLSEVYYRQDWRNVDEYAQRLWTLVENKFL